VNANVNNELYVPVLWLTGDIDMLEKLTGPVKTTTSKDAFMRMLRQQQNAH
jgi:hypothetical protein